jgi:hypothetical protein
VLTDPKLRSDVDKLWDKLWTGGLSNPMDAIEQLSYLIFLKRLRLPGEISRLTFESAEARGHQRRQHPVAVPRTRPVPRNIVGAKQSVHGATRIELCIPGQYLGQPAVRMGLPRPSWRPHAVMG